MRLMFFENRRFSSRILRMADTTTKREAFPLARTYGFVRDIVD